jgi:uncharacterized RDD family membrane protein YckC
MSDYGTPPPPPPASGPAAPVPAAGQPAPPAPYAASTDGVGGLAGWPLRAGGYVIDSLLPAIPGGILVAIGMAMASSGAQVDPATGDLSGGNPAGWVVAGIGYVAMFAFQVWNRWIKGGQGQSIGRKMVGVTLLGEESGQPIGTLKAFLRDIAHILDTIVCGLPIGYLWPLWDAKRQTWADKVMKTVVVTVAK